MDEEQKTQAEIDRATAPHAPTPGVPKVAVIFEYWRHDGTRGTNRVFYEGITVLRTSDEVLALEKRILESSVKDGITRVLITNQFPLER